MKLIRKTFVACILFLILVINSCYAYEPNYKDPNVINDIDIVDQETGLRLRDYIWYLPDSFASQLEDCMDNEGSYTKDGLKKIAEEGNKSIGIEVEKLDSSNEDYNKILNKYKDELYKDPKNNNNYVISAFKINITKKSNFEFLSAPMGTKVVIPLRRVTKSGEIQNRHFEHDVGVYVLHKDPDTGDVIKPLNTEDADTYISNPKKGLDDLVVADVQDGDCIFVATKKMTKIPENMMPGVYDTRVELLSLIHI